jgi:hypothetical protein
LLLKILFFIIIFFFFLIIDSIIHITDKYPNYANSKTFNFDYSSLITSGINDYRLSGSTGSSGNCSVKIGDGTGINGVVPLFNYLEKQNTLYVSDYNNPSDVNDCGSFEKPCKRVRYTYKNRVTDHTFKICIYKKVTDEITNKNEVQLTDTSKSAVFYGEGDETLNGYVISICNHIDILIDFNNS